MNNMKDSNSNGIDKTLKCRMLAAPLVIKNYVTGDNRVNYEVYLTELINNSEYFLQKSGGSEYVFSENQSEGQCDAVSDGYKIDFKLTASTSRLEALHLHSMQIQAIKGMTTFSASRERGETLASNLNSCLRAIKSFDEINSIIDNPQEYIRRADRNQDNIRKQISSDVRDFLLKMKTDKNLLFYIPEELLYEHCLYDEETELEKIREAIDVDFNLVLRYRSSIKPKYDTFLSCVYKKQMLFFKFDSNVVVLVDKVDLEKSETYKYIKHRYADWS